MKTVAKIKKVLESGILKYSLTSLPTGGISDIEISVATASLSRPLSSIHRFILNSWDGLNLDVIRVYSINQRVRGVKVLLESQNFSPFPGAIVFADDPAGFVYVEGFDGTIYSLDSDSDELKELTPNMDIFFDRLVFGANATEFLGTDWANELRVAGVV